MSKTATCGTSGSASRARWISSSARRLERRDHRDSSSLLDLGVQKSWGDEAAPAVDDAVPDGVGRGEAIHLPRLVPADEVKLEARGACVDHQDVDGRGFS